MLRDQITEALKTAMKAKDERATGTVRMIMAKLKERDIEARAKGNNDGVKDDEILSLLQGMIKQRRESIDLYNKGNRADLAQQETEEIAVIERFLPKQMSEAEVKEAITKAIAESGATNIKDMGKVMAALKASYAGQMDFGKASGLIKGLLG
ncbi:MAG: GatB/YqeY domain-containing protein [Alphaproteobacteria bacterium]|nr:GatB/YqeY domain-containing protein [Alphaproteobacteria bacterium]